MSELDQEILRKIDDFGPLITDLSNLLQAIENEEERKKYRFALGSVMGLLEGDIAYPIRLRLGILWTE